MKVPAVVYLALTILLAYPLSIHPASRVMSDAPDTRLYLWTLAWDAHAFLHQPLAIFDANIFYPEPRTLAYSENLLGSAVVAAPILWLTGNPVLAMNLVVLVASVLCGLGAYLLARRVGVGACGAMLAGAIFAFSPPRFLRLDQVHLATIQWIPFALAFFHTYLDEGRRRDLHLALAFVTLQALTSGHGAVLLGVAMAALFAYRVALGDPLAAGARLRDLGASGALILAPVVLTVVPYLRVQHDVGLRRTLADNWGVPASSFLASPTRLHAFLLSLVSGARINDTAGAYLFPGYLPIVLAVLAFVLRDPARAPARARSDARWFYGLLLALSIGLAAGPPLGLWPLVYWLPGFSFVRAPSRFMLLGVLALAVLAGIGFDRLAARMAPDRRRLLASVFCLLLVCEFATIPLGTDPYRVEIPAIDRWLAAQPAPLVVAEVPVPSPTIMGRSERWQSTYMLYSTAGWWKTVHGYSGFITPAHFELFRQLATFPDAESIRGLAALGVTRVVVHADDYPPEQWLTVKARLGEMQSSMTLEHAEGEDRVYSIHAAAAPR
jgi:hypothetical protein